MLNPTDVIKAINKATEPFLMDNETPFCLSRHSHNSIRLRINDNASTAYNIYGNDGELVNVAKWFNDFWIFVEIQFLNPIGTIISLSIFEGKESDPNKTQLFRAEWDDYGDQSIAHPQPHWHFLTNKTVENTTKEFAELIVDEKETFMQFLDEEINKVIDLSKFHFAMHADWGNNNPHVHSITNEQILANWFGGLLGYLKTELEYVHKKRTIQ